LSQRKLNPVLHAAAAAAALPRPAAPYIHEYPSLQRGGIVCLLLKIS